MPLQKAHKRRRRAFLTELTLKRHRLSSYMNDVANTVPVSFDAEAGTVVENSDMVPVSLDAETGPVTVESSVTTGKFYLA